MLKPVGGEVDPAQVLTHGQKRSALPEEVAQLYVDVLQKHWKDPSRHGFPDQPPDDNELHVAEPCTVLLK